MRACGRMEYAMAEEYSLGRMECGMRAGGSTTSGMVGLDLSFRTEMFSLEVRPEI